MTRGEVWWANLPSPAGRRPVLIVTRTSAVSARNQLVVAQITRTIHSIPAEVPLAQTDGMPQNCVVNCDVLLTVPKSRLERKIAKLSDEKMAEVDAALRFSLELP